MSLLRTAFASRSIAILQRVNSRSEAIEIAGSLLVESGRTTTSYTESMLEAVDSYGPYIVIAPGIALAHGKPSESVIETGLSLLLLREPIEFKHSQNDPVSIVFGLAALDHDSHLGLMAELAEFLSDSAQVNSLLIAEHETAIRNLFG